MKYVLFFIFLLFLPVLHAQVVVDTVKKDSVYTFEKEPFFHRNYSHHIGCERMPVIVAEMRFAGHNLEAGGIGIAISGGNQGCMGGANSGAGVSCLYEWGTKTFIPSIDAWSHAFVGIIGLTMRLKVQYLINEYYRAPALQPQIGIGFVRVHFMYGHNFYINKPEGVNLARNCFTVWFNIPTIEEKQRFANVY